MLIQQTRELIDYAPFMAMTIAIVVALTQVYLQNRQFDLNLFDKRYKVYAAMDEFITTILNGNGAMGGAVSKFRADTAHAEFLFGQDVIAFIGLVTAKAMDLSLVATQLQAHVNAHLEFQRGVTNAEPPTTSIAKLNESHSELMGWMIKAQVEQNAVFRHSLKLHHERLWIVRWMGYIKTWVENADDNLKSRYRAT